MADSLLRYMFRRLPQVARRDRKIARLKRRLSALENDLATRTEWSRDVRRPSYQARIHAERRLRRLSAELGMPSRSVIRRGKFHVYDLARSHGIEPPVEFGRWDEPNDIPWSELPDLVVIKSARGAHGRGVFPLRRSDHEWDIITADESMSSEQITKSLTASVDDGQAGPPFVAEEFLDEDGSGTRLPTDVKVYAFYGDVPMVVLRRPGRLGEHPLVTPFRVLDAHGDDVTDVDTGSIVDPSMPVPAKLDEIVAAASRLSVAIRAPFSRLDFYGIGDRVVFGEVTPRPGGSAWHGEAVDRRLGEAWERAQIRLDRDLASGMPHEPEFGPYGA